MSVCKRGHVGARLGKRGQCLECQKLRSDKWRRLNPDREKFLSKQWRENNAEHKRQTDRAYYLANHEKIKERARKYERANKDKVLKKWKQWWVNNKAAHYEHCKKWAHNNPLSIKASQGKRRAARLSATPSWADNEALKVVYYNCPKGMEVDHIVPLINSRVCGLHVPWNLQYLTKSENSSKGNRFVDHSC